MSPAFDYLQTWFRAQCNGFWEHGHGVTIETLDNGGWMVTIDIAETTLEGQPLLPIRKERNEKDWIVCSVEHGKFKGQGDSAKLDEILENFAAWAGESAPK
jgi:hypothetical protein